MIDVIKATEILKSNIEEQKEIIEKKLIDSVGFILGEDIKSSINVPEFPKSAMDGYAVNSEDLKDNSKFEVIDEIYAGDTGNENYIKNSAIRVMTGSFIPDGYDCVVRQEDTDYGKSTVEIFKKEKRFSNYCHIGEDIKKNDLILKAGTLIRPVHLGVLASLGLNEVKVVKPLRVTLISTGSELLYPGDKLTHGKIYSSTSYTISAYLEKYNIEVVKIEIVKDSLEEIENKIKEFSKISDVVITTGGVSVGKYDLIPKVYENISESILFRKVAMKPGTPVSSAKLSDAIILSFSGNPFAALANFQVLFWPLASKYYNCIELDNILHEKIIVKGSLKPSKLQRYVRAKYYNETVEIADIHASSVLSNLLNCNCLIVQERNELIKEGDKVKVIYLP